MTASELASAVLVGFAAGLAFFGGLWWTVRRLPSARHPALLSLTSGLLRSAVTCAAFAWVAVPSWQRFVACLAGFVLARMLWVRRVGVAAAEEARDADNA